MLKLVFYTKDVRLKVRHANQDDDLSTAVNWKDKIQFIVSDVGDFTIVWTSFLPDLEPEYAEAMVDLVGARFPVSPYFENLRKVSTGFVFENPSEEWVFFGGTFNPWHQGHQACLDLLPKEKTCLILPDRNPNKELREIHQVLTVLEISNKTKLKNNQFLVPSFLFLKDKNPTIEWIERVHYLFPEQKLSLLLGFDSFKSLPNWIRSNDLLNLLGTIYVVSRLEDRDLHPVVAEEMKKLNPDLEIVFLGGHDFEKVSSTSIRKK